MTTNVVVSRITLFSSKMDLAAEFYNAIGLNLGKSVHGWGPGYNYLDVIRNKEQDIIFEIYPLAYGTPVVSPQGLGFDIEGLQQTLQKLVAMDVPVIRPGNPRVYSHCSLAVVRDPDGRSVTLTQHRREE